MLRRVFLTLALCFLCTLPMTIKAAEDTDGSRTDLDGPVCNQTVTEEVIQGLTNVTFFNTCAEGKTFSMKNLLALRNFTESDLTSFCNSTVCVKALHLLHEEAPLDCLITAEEGDDAINASATLGELHHECHAIQHKLAEANGNSSSNGSTNSTGGSKSSYGLSTQQINTKTFVLTLLVSLVMGNLLL